MTDRDREINPLGFTVLNYNLTNLSSPEKKPELGKALGNNMPASVNQAETLPTTSQLTIPPPASAPNVVVPEIKPITVPNSNQGGSSVVNGTLIPQTQVNSATVGAAQTVPVIK